jgi:hypothetical protein
MTALRTERLRLRPFRLADLEACEASAAAHCSSTMRRLESGGRRTIWR